MYNTFNLHDYHFIWYILGFLVAPRISLAVIVSVYTPIALWLKIIMWLLVFVHGTSRNNKEVKFSYN